MCVQCFCSLKYFEKKWLKKKQNCLFVQSVRNVNWGEPNLFPKFFNFHKKCKNEKKLGCVFRNSNRLQQLTVRKDLFFNESPATVTGECGIKFKTKWNWNWNGHFQNKCDSTNHLKRYLHSTFYPQKSAYKVSFQLSVSCRQCTYVAYE